MEYRGRKETGESIKIIERTAGGMRRRCVEGGVSVRVGI